MKALAAGGPCAFNWRKSVLSVADRLGLTPDEAKAEILRLIQTLTPDEFSEAGDGVPAPPCDIYRVERSHLDATGRFNVVEWYIKIGISEGPTPQLWVESCHS